MKKFLQISVLLIFILCAFSLVVSASDTCEHDLVEAYTYESGFLKSGSYSATCTKCDHSVTEEKDPMFVVNGVSFNEDEADKKITYGYIIEQGLLKEYERINSCEITCGYLISTGFNYSEDKKTVKRDNISDLASLDIVVKCGNDALTSCDVVMAGSYTVTKDGISETTYFQDLSSYGLNSYENPKYGDAKVGVSYNTISQALNADLTWQDSKGINDGSGAVQSSGTQRAAMTTMVTVKEGDTISIPEDSEYRFILYAYHLDGTYYGYVDTDITGSTNWGKSYTFREGMKTGDGSKTIDVNDLCVRIVFRKDDNGANGAISIDNIKPLVTFNFTNSSFVKVSFEGCDYESMYFAQGRELGEIEKPVKEGYQFAGWYAKDDVNYTTPYYSDTTINESVTLVPLWRRFPVENLTWIDNTQISDATGATETSSKSNARVTISSFIKVQNGDTISIPTDSGYRFIVYFYSDANGAYTNNSVIDINDADTSSNAENWGYTYTFGKTLVGYKGSPTMSIENAYVRIVFRKDDNGANGAISSADIKSLVTFEIGADNSHLVPAENEPEVTPSELLLADQFIISHRGESNTAPENTLPAFEQAIANGVKVHEADIQFTSDGIPVLLHDTTIDRTSNGTGSVSSLTLEVLKTYDFGSWKSSEYEGTQIVTLEEFALFCKENGVCMELDLANRGFSADQKKTIYSIIKENDMLGSTIFTATNAELAGYISLNSNIIVSVSGITSSSTATVLSNYSSCALVFASVPYANFTADLATTINGYGDNMRVKVWTATSQDAVNTCFANGANAVLVDNTVLALPTNEE